MIRGRCIEYFLEYIPEDETWFSIIKTTTALAVGIHTKTRRKKLRGRIITFGNKGYSAAVLAWFYMTGEMPILEVDHKDCNRDNNKWSNLRLADRCQQNSNRKLFKSNKFGCKGICYVNKIKKYKAKVIHRGKVVFQKEFKTLEAAITARKEQASKYFGEFARHE